MKKFIVGLVISVLFVQSAFAVASFSDVSSDSRNATAIGYLYEQGVISGYPDGTFQPNKTVNRAELAKILVGGVNEQPTLEEYNDCFPDVTDQWFAPYVCFAKAQNWIAGYSDGTFKPERTVNKVEAIKMLVNSQGFTVWNNATTNFSDVESNEWYYPYIVSAEMKGLLESKYGVYGVDLDMTRGEVSENIYRALIVRKEGVPSFNATLLYVADYAYYASSLAKTKYYCETDPAWEDLSPTNLLKFNSEQKVLDWMDVVGRSLTLNQPC